MCLIFTFKLKNVFHFNMKTTRGYQSIANNYAICVRCTPRPECCPNVPDSTTCAKHNCVPFLWSMSHYHTLYSAGFLILLRASPVSDAVRISVCLDVTLCSWRYSNRHYLTDGTNFSLLGCYVVRLALQ